jgi:DNA replication protein DnaC
MQRHDVLEQLKALKLYGMAGSFEETLTHGVRQQQTMGEVMARLCQAEAAERRVRSIRYQLGRARFPVAKDLDRFQFDQSPVNKTLVRELYNGSFLEQARNLIFIGGTGTGKTHLSIAIASHCIKQGYRGRFFLS